MLFVQATLLTKYFKVFFLNVGKVLLPLLYTSEQTWQGDFKLLKLRYKWGKRQNVHWSKRARMVLLGIWGVECWSLFWGFFSPSSTDQQRFFNGRRLCVEAARRGQVLSLWNYVVSFRLWCWDVQKSQQYNTSEESHIWALNTLINVSMWFKGKDEDYFSSLRTSVLLCGCWNIFVSSLRY